MKKLSFIFVLILSACGGISDRRITNDNVFDYVEVSESGTFNNGAFFAPKNKKDFVSCLSVQDRCFKKHIKLGKQLNIKEFEVSFSGGHTDMNLYPKDKLLIVAAMVAVQDGYSFIIPVSHWSQSSTTKSSPVAYTSCNSYGSGGFCTSSVRQDTRYYESYSMNFIAYNDYNDIKNGVLTDRKENDGTGSPYQGLYDTEDGIDSKYGFMGREPGGFQFTDRGHTRYEFIPDAWKATYNAASIIQGENIKEKIRKFNIKRYRPSTSNYMSVGEKYKQ